MKKSFPLYAIILFACIGFPLFSQPKIVIVTPGFDHPVALVAAKVLPEAYKKIGYEIEFRTLPPARALETFDLGTVDGYIFSDPSFVKDHPKAVRVECPIGHDDLMVFTTKVDFHVEGWESLKPYSVGYQVGMLVVENNLKNVKGLKMDPSQDPPQAFQKMMAGRTDIVVMPRGVGLIMIKNMKLQGVKMLSPALEAVELYHFLISKRADIAPKLAAVLTEMTKNGELKKITNEVESGFLQ